MKLSEKQKECIMILRKYPEDIIMHDCWLTGGHGVKFDGRTVQSLKKKGIICSFSRKITELGKTIQL